VAEGKIDGKNAVKISATIAVEATGRGDGTT